MEGRDGRVLYREVQRFTQPWIWALVLAISIFAIYASVQQLVLGVPFGSNPAPDGVMLVIGVIFGLAFPVFFSSLNLSTEVRPDGLYIRFFPFHLSYRGIALRELAHFEVTTYDPIKDYGGWGIRYGPRGKAYNVSGNRGLRVDLLDGDSLLIGSQRPEELLSALASAVSAQ